MTPLSDSCHVRLVSAAVRSVNAFRPRIDGAAIHSRSQRSEEATSTDRGIGVPPVAKLMAMRPIL